MPLPKEIDENIGKHLDLLIEGFESLIGPLNESEALADIYSIDGKEDLFGLEIDTSPYMVKYYRFSSSAKNLVRFVVGEPNSRQYLGDIEDLEEAQANTIAISERYLGRLQSFRDDYESGILDGLYRKIEANVTHDFMEQAEQLLGGERHNFDQVPAAVLAGAVLEDSVRRLCQRQDPPIETEVNGNPKKLDLLISDLQKRNVINKPKAAQLRSWASIRNSAAHGRFDEFTRSDAGQMLAGIKIFLADYL